jgi:sirohydrochlorin ferrochelatase
MKEGVLLLAHGSRRQEANEEILAIARLVKAKNPEGIYEIAFMSFGTPNIGEGTAALVSRGINRVIVMPLFLVTGNHITQDIPAELIQQKELFPHVEFVMAQHLAGHPAIVDIVLERIAGAGGQVPCPNS